MFQWFRKKKSSQPKTLRRAPRVELLPLQEVSFQLKNSEGTVALPASNISSSGAGLLRSAMKAWPPEGEIMRGALRVGSKSVPCELKLVHLSPLVAGCAFEGDTGPVAACVKSYFDAEMEGMDLRQINSSFLKRPERGTPHWFSGNNSCELYLVEENGQLSEFEIRFFGNRLVWNEDHGRLHFQSENQEETSERSGPHHRASELMGPSEPIPEGLMESIERFIQHANGLPGEWKKQIRDRLTMA